MSAIGAALAKGLAALGGPGPAAAIVAGGLVVGALGGGFVASGGRRPGRDLGGRAGGLRVPRAPGRRC